MYYILVSTIIIPVMIKPAFVTYRIRAENKLFVTHTYINCIVLTSEKK